MEEAKEMFESTWKKARDTLMTELKKNCPDYKTLMHDGVRNFVGTQRTSALSLNAIRYRRSSAETLHIQLREEH